MNGFPSEQRQWNQSFCIELTLLLNVDLTIIWWLFFAVLCQTYTIIEWLQWAHVTGH